MPHEIRLGLNIQSTVEISLPVIVADAVTESNKSTIEHPDGSKTVYYFVTFENKKRVSGILEFDANGNQTSTTARSFSRNESDKLVREEYIIDIPIGETVTHAIYVDNVQTSSEQVSMSMSIVQFVVRAVPNEELLPIGTEVNMPWEDSDIGRTYNNPMVLVHYGNFVKEADSATGTQTWMAIFRQKGAVSNGIIYDAPEQVEASEATAQAGLYYYGKISSDKYQLLSLETGDAIPYNDYLAVYKNDIQDTDANGTVNASIIYDGYTSWKYSSLRQWMNSDGDPGEWWTAQHVGDSEPSDHSTRHGFMAGFNDDDLAGLQTIKIATRNENGETDYTYDTFWEPSNKELYGSGNDPESVSDWKEYWHDFIGIETPGNSKNNLRMIKDISGGITTRAIALRTIRDKSTQWALQPATSGSGMMTVYTGTISYRQHPKTKTSVLACCAVG